MNLCCSCVAANHVPDKVEFVNDLNRLCVLFGHIELLLTVAASIHRKLLHVPRLCKTIFLDIYNFYIPRLGQRLVESSDDEVRLFLSIINPCASSFSLPTHLLGLNLSIFLVLPCSLTIIFSHHFAYISTQF